MTDLRHDVELVAGELRERRDELIAIAARDGHIRIAVPELSGPDEFAHVRDALLPVRASYVEGATPRTAFGDGVFSSTDTPPNRDIAPHNENSYAAEFPGHLLFYCFVAAEQGGATTTCDVRAVLASIDAAVLTEFDRRGWALVRTYSEHVGLPWTTAFGTTARDEVDAYCAAHEVSTAWRGERLRTRQVRQAVIDHPGSGAPAWFNHVVFWHGSRLPREVQQVLTREHGTDWPFRTTYGDGAEIPDEVIEHLADCYRQHLRAEPWRPGELMLVDNLSAAHGRERYRGSRSIVVAMGTPLRRRNRQAVPAHAPAPA